MSKYRIITEAGYYNVQRKKLFKWENVIIVRPPISDVVTDEHKEFIESAKSALEVVKSLRKADEVIKGTS